MQVLTVSTQPFDDQRPGTAGLRRKVSRFQQPNYLENFVQAVFDAQEGYEGGTLILGGDGRYHNNIAIQTIVCMAAANGIGRVIVGRDGLLSTPAASHLVRKYQAFGGFILTASHNPAGPDGDFGIKFDVDNGGQASEQLTEAVYQRTRSITCYRIADLRPLDFSHEGAQQLGGMALEVIDPVDDYARLMQSLFDFDRIRERIASGFEMRFDAMHGVTGPYAERILGRMLGVPSSSLYSIHPLPDFGGGHPDPNLKYARRLVNEMYSEHAPAFGAASDGDGDRNMILGPGTFVSPGDSLAVLCANAAAAPGYRDGLRGVARSMPTSRAVDHVARKQGIDCYETPTGWRFFCNLLDAGRISLCGEESFGTGSSHVREKDGVWAVLFWLNLMAESGLGVADLLHRHWREYGRHYYARHDYEGLDPDQAGDVMNAVRDALATLPGQAMDGWEVSQADEFDYKDPVDGSESTGQGLRVVFGEQARFVMRLSGTGTGGATLRLYLERFEPERVDATPDEMLQPLSDIADRLSRLQEITGRTEPSVIT